MSLKLKSSFLKTLLKKMKRKAIDQEKIFAKCISDKRLQSIMYKEFSNSIIGKQMTQFFKWAKDLSKCFTIEDI